MFRRVKDVAHPHEQMLSVYREHGVVRKESRDDNFNKTAENRNIYQLVDDGWLIVNRMKAWQGSLGISPYRGIVSGHYICFEPTHQEDSRFLNYLLRSGVYRVTLQQMSRGVRPSQIEIDNDELRALHIHVPPLAEQRAIADYLDVETARIDALIAKKQQLIRLLEERVAALIDEYFAPCEGDSTVRLARLATVQSGITLNAGNVKSSETVRRPYLRVANVQPGWLNLAEVKEVDVEPAAAVRSLLRAGDVLMTEGGDIDKLGRGTVWRGEIPNCLHQNHVFAVRPNAGVLDSNFLANVTRTSYARAYFESTGVQSTNLASTNSFKVADFRVPALDLGAQRARCIAYERVAEPLSDSCSKLKQQIDLLAEHRQALITAAVTGELAVSSVA